MKFCTILNPKATLIVLITQPAFACKLLAAPRVYTLYFSRRYSL